MGMRHYLTGRWRGGLKPSTRSVTTSNTWLGQVVPVLVKRMWKLFPRCVSSLYPYKCQSDRYCCNCDGVILTHAVPQRQNVNAQYFRHFLENNLRPALRRTHPHFLQNPPIILQENVRAHMAHPVADLYRRWGWEVLFHPSHSPDLSPCDYDLIPKLKEPLRDIRFQTVPDILWAVGRSVRNIDRTGTATGIRRLLHRWQRVVDNAGGYIEGL